MTSFSVSQNLNGFVLAGYRYEKFATVPALFLNSVINCLQLAMSNTT